jgi:aspartate/methionine/tyrosine aminotransferase
MPDDLRDPIDALAGNLAICPPALSQHAAISAFEAYEECDGHVVRYAWNREVMLEGLRELGIDRLAPADGAFYVYADIGHLTDDSQDWGRRLLDATGVAVAPGIDFDQVDGARSIRLSFAGATDTITAGLQALRGFLSG